MTVQKKQNKRNLGFLRRRKGGFCGGIVDQDCQLSDRVKLEGAGGIFSLIWSCLVLEVDMILSGFLRVF
jgi:hypothetical protein